MNYKDKLILENLYEETISNNSNSNSNRKRIVDWLKSNTNIHRSPHVQCLEITDDYQINFGDRLTINCDVVSIPTYINFNNVHTFDINYGSLTTLVGCPNVCKNFTCNGCDITNLIGAPKKCIYFSCFNCPLLISLEGAPITCRIFDCNYCKKLKDLKYSPRECKIFTCQDCDSLNKDTKYPTDKYGYMCNIQKFKENHSKRSAQSAKDFGEEGSSLF